MLSSRPIIFVFFVCTSIAIAASARGADFRVDNAVYVGEDAKPQTQGTTIFHQGLVYDFLNDPAEIIIFDKDHGRFVLLDVGHHVKSDLSIDDVKAIVERAKQRLAGHTNPQLRWLGDPAFDETLDREKSEVTLRSDWLTYQAQLLPTGPEVAGQYHEFTDMVAELNYAITPGSRPPFARMMLNDALDRNHGIAREVRLTSNFTTGEPPQKIISRHQLAAALDASDANRIAQADDGIKTFRRVSLKEYMQKK